MDHATLEELRGISRTRMREHTKELNLAFESQRWPNIKSLLASAIADKELANRRVDDWLDGWNDGCLSREQLTHLALQDDDFVFFLDL